MPAALRVESGRESFRRGAFVRMAGGQYKGDLAHVVDVLDGGARLVVRFVPRDDKRYFGIGALKDF